MNVSNEMLQKEMVGHTFTSVAPSANDAELIFESDTLRVRFYHKDECCEIVQLEEIIGDLTDLEGSPILLAEEVTSEDCHISDLDRDLESFTWTFYKFATMKGAVTVRFLGSSNGYYSESVDIEFETK